MLDKNFSLSHQVFDQLEKAIIKGDVPAGTVITESELSAKYGVSRTPIREAVSMLEQEGLVESKKSGIQVIGISVQDLFDFMDIRILLEGKACAAVAKNITEEGLETLRKTFRLQEFYASHGQTEDISRMDTDFHHILFRYCGRTYARFLDEIHKKLQKYRAIAMDERSRAEQSLSEHGAILAAVEARDEKEIERTVTLHVTNAKKRMLGE